MSNELGDAPEPSLIRAVATAVRAMQSATARLDDAAAHHLGINRTDLAILGRLESGPLSPSAVASAVGITAPSVTVAMQRLQAKGLVEREPDPDDRRRARVRLTGEAADVLRAIYQPVQTGGMQLLGAMSDDELRTVLRFLAASTDLQQDQAERVASGFPRS